MLLPIKNPMFLNYQTCNAVLKSTTSAARSFASSDYSRSVRSSFPSPIRLLMVVDILLRTYLIFLGTVMAHESVHGHLGRTKAANFWWGRIALIPSMVPFTNFRKTHQLHHAHTNIPDHDPDHFMKSRNFFELFLRALAMPHHWFFWLRKRGRIKRDDVIELVLNYLGIVLVFSSVLAFGWR